MASADRPTLARALLLGCRAGLLVFLALYVLCAVLDLRLGSQGNESRLVSDFAWSEWRGVVLGQVARLLAAHAVAGLVLGALLGAGLWAAGAGRKVVLWGSALACLTVDVLLVLGGMAHHPHLYAATLYERSAATRWLLVTVSGTPPMAWHLGAAVLPAMAFLRLLARAPWRVPALALGGALGAALLLGTGARGKAGTPPLEEKKRTECPHLLILSADGPRPDPSPATATHAPRTRGRR